MKNLLTPLRFIQITDLHLSDEPATPTGQTLDWAIARAASEHPDFVVVSGDMTTHGTAASAQRVHAALKALTCPVHVTIGNAEHRGSGAIGVLNAPPLLIDRFAVYADVLFLFPDTSRGNLPDSERAAMHTALQSHPARRACAIITHYPQDALEADSRAWLAEFIARHQVELLVAGHKHLHRARQIGCCTEIVTRGLDPDKASGDLPGISLFERSPEGLWTEAFLPWAFPVALGPWQIDHLSSPVGWSIKGDPIAAVRETRATDLQCLELRPAELDFSSQALNRELAILRSHRDTYLSWHLPSLSWEGSVIGEAVLVDHVRCALDAGVNHLTVHVPQAPSHQMRDPDTWRQFADAFDRLFRSAVSQGVRLGIENVHNISGVRPEDPACKFATDIDAYEAWIDGICDRFADVPDARVGAHFDIGHARNNGELGNVQPLGVWYARIGRRILGYHIHQIRNDAETGKLTNHREMFTPFDLRISYAGFIHAWSTQQINRAPLFIEIRDDGERRRSTRRVQKLFRRQQSIRTSLDLPGRK